MPLIHLHRHWPKQSRCLLTNPHCEGAGASQAHRGPETTTLAETLHPPHIWTEWKTDNLISPFYRKINTARAHGLAWPWSLILWRPWSLLSQAPLSCASGWSSPQGSNPGHYALVLSTFPLGTSFESHLIYRTPPFSLSVLLFGTSQAGMLLTAGSQSLQHVPLPLVFLANWQLDTEPWSDSHGTPLSAL